MRIVSIHNLKSSFGSKNSPIESFNIKTPKGTLFVREYKLNDFRDSNKIQKLAQLSVDNLVEGSTDPQWEQMVGSRDRTEYLDQVDQFTHYYKKLFRSDDGNTTFLVAKDIKNRPRAAIVMSHFDEIEDLDDAHTGYIETLVVDKKYRGLNVGKVFVEKAEKTANGVFTDIFIEAFNRAKPFYENNGFTELDMINLKIKSVAEKIMEYRDDVPKFVTLMSKPIDENAERWFERLFKRL